MFNLIYVIMKQRKKISYLLLTIGIALFSACNSDNDGAFSSPEYEDLSAKFEVTDNYSEISSLELTASGNYIVTYKHNINKSNETRSAKTDLFNTNIFRTDISATRATTDRNIIYGKFTARGKNTYQLEGYGTVTITTDKNNAYTLDIVCEDGSTISVGARKEEVFESSEMTDKLCRTWEIENIGYKIVSGEREFNKVVKIDNIYELYEEYIDFLIEVENIKDQYTIDAMKASVENMANSYNETRPLSVIFTKSGSYIVERNNSTIGIAIWMWENEEEGYLRYSWDSNNIYYGGLANVEFSKKQLRIHETEESPRMTTTVMYDLKEVK